MDQQTRSISGRRRDTKALTETGCTSPNEVFFKGRAMTCALTASALTLAFPAHALDGCLVLLCLAAPSWSAIPQCVPPIHQLLLDLARGRVFPTCAMAGAGNSAGHQWANAPSFCPPQYTRSYEAESGTNYACDYAGAVTVNIDGRPWSQVWWSLDKGTTTEYFPSAKAQLGTWDPTFERDYAAWLGRQASPVTPPPCLPSQC